MESDQAGTLRIQPKRSHNVKGTPLFKELDKELVYQIYEELDLHWNVSGFVPCPIQVIAQKFKLTATQIMYVILAWRESRMKREIYGQENLNLKEV
jgi:hypothetical protein